MELREQCGPGRSPPTPLPYFDHMVACMSGDGGNNLAPIHAMHGMRSCILDRQHHQLHTMMRMNDFIQQSAEASDCR